MTNDLRHAGRVAVVTGAGAGIGRRIAQQMAAEGAVIVVNDIDARTAADTADSLPRPPDGRSHLAVAADLSSSAEVDQLFAVARENYSGLDVLVCNAGVSRTPGDGRAETGRTHQLRDLSDDAWRQMIAVNLDSVFFCCREAVRSTAGRGNEAIVCMSSIAAQTGNGPIHYTASKAGVIGLVRSISLEVAALGIRINAVCPGAVDTQMLAGVPDDMRRGLAGRIPLGRVADADEVASVVSFLASREASYITGQVIAVNGGFHIG